MNTNFKTPDLKFFIRFYENNPIWAFCFALITTLYIIGVIIFGFDIQIEKGSSRKALVSIFENDGTSNFYFKIDDEYAVIMDIEDGEVWYTGITTYTMNYVPFCFTCGWNRPTGGGFNNVYQKGDLFYNPEPKSYESDEAPEGVYEYYDAGTGERGYVEDLDDLGNNLDKSKYEIDAEEIAENYSEISMSGPDDEDCMVLFAALILCYFILLIWLVIASLIKLIRGKKEPEVMT